jgi:predicted phosphoribosyltransferase
MTGLKTVGVTVGFNVAKKLTRKVRSMVNRDIIKPLQMGDFVKV